MANLSLCQRHVTTLASNTVLHGDLVNAGQQRGGHTAPIPPLPLCSHPANKLRCSPCCCHQPQQYLHAAPARLETVLSHCSVASAAVAGRSPLLLLLLRLQAESWLCSITLSYLWGPQHYGSRLSWQQQQPCHTPAAAEQRRQGAGQQAPD